MQTQTDETSRKEVIFDENGQTVEVVEAIEGGEVPSGEAGAEETSAAAKYRIGDREFTTQEEALAYAQNQVSALETETQVADAYRQGIRDAIAQNGTVPAGVTPSPLPQKPALDPAELYSNPAEFLAKYAQQIKSEVTGELNQASSLKTQSDQIWREFADRHPNLADFRNEVETFVASNTPDVRAIISTKGRPASYDFIATKLKSRFEAYAGALKPKRELPNTGGGGSPNAKATGITPPAGAKKALSFAEQIRSIRKRR